MQLVLRFLTIPALALLAAGAAFAQPANDLFANAWTLTGSIITTNGSSSLPVNATKEAGEPNHAGLPGGRSVWFTWTAPVNGQTRIDTIGSGFNTLLGVYTGASVSTLTLVAANDNISEGFGGNNASRVEFFAAAGTTYRIAIDGRGGFGGQNPASGSYVLNLRVLASVFITSPTNGSIITLGTPIPINVEASVPGATVTRVDFYRAGTLIDSDSTAPFGITVASPPPGTNSYVAVAVDNAGLSWTSAVVNVAVLSLGVTVVSPPDGTVFLNNNPITVSAVGLLSSGSMTNVEFFVDGTKFGEDASAPFSAVWNTVAPGSHRFTAIGRDDAGNAYNAAAVNIAVARTVVPRGSVWRFLDNGTDQGTNWTTRGFDDAAWLSGPAELGYGDGDEATLVGFGPDANNRYITTYFRHTFNITGAAEYSGLVMNVKRDDGAVVYVNGVEAARFNMNPGPVLFNTLAPNAGDDGANFNFALVPTNLLVEGANVVAVEIHQTTLNSSDISFEMDLSAVPVIIRNQTPSIQLDAPANNATFLAPPSITLDATASDADGTVAKVEFFADGVKLGEDTESPYSFVWSNPPIGPHVVHATATDAQGASAQSAASSIVIYDAAGTPFVRITQPVEGAVAEGPTNLTVTAEAFALNGVQSVVFSANNQFFGLDQTKPYSSGWNAPFGSNALTAIVIDTTDKRGTSVVVNVFISTPPTNTIPPTVARQVPMAGSNVTSLTNLAITFSERVQNVDASDLLVNGVPATQVSGSGSNYVFNFPQPAYGTVAISWALGHGITDFGFPSVLPFDSTGPGATWEYELIDRDAPVIVTRVPAAGTTVTNLTQIAVTFSEPVGGVDAADLLVNGTPAFGLAGSGANYSFSISQPAAGSVSVSWAGGHGITDLATSPNAFNATGPGATWTVTLDNRTTLVQSNSNWQFIKGRAEASSPIGAWRQPGFDDSGWSNALAPFFYGDAYGSVANPGTQLTDMLGGYSSIYLRRKFTLLNAGLVTNLFLNAQSDDGFIAWINGVEIVRYNMAAGDIPYNGEAPSAVNEPNNSGAAYINTTLANSSAYLLEGENVITVHAFNNQPNSSSDFGFNAQLYAFLPDPSVVPPRIAGITPPSGELFYLTNLTVRFTEPVEGVTAEDLLVNGVPASALESTTNTTYTFRFAQPEFGPVAITWAVGHGVVDLDTPPKSFDGAAPGATLNYSLINPSAPIIAGQSPLAGASINHLTQLAVTFGETVTGVDATDLLVNGVAATGMTGAGSSYTFTFTQPAYGTVSIGWAANNGIRDTEPAANPFDGTRQGNVWNYTLIDQTAPVLTSIAPPTGSLVTNLTQVTVTFSEAVAGVTAADLLVNSVPATGVSGGPSIYTFTFAQVNATILNFTWINAHGIRDLAPVPNSFDAGTPGATWSYTTPDTLAPSLAGISPVPFVTLRSLGIISVTFAEPVVGVDTNDLLLNNRRAFAVTGSGAGPYTFNYQPPSNGVIEVRWVEGHGITDLATPAPNAFTGGEWTYILDPNATFAGKIVINELMFNPLGGRPVEEWLELRNVTTNLINLAGWRFTRGINFTFPNVAISAGGYLVVAADLPTFRAKFPVTSNVVGGWTGRLANTDETLELETALGESVNEVHYATEGDWARRERGRGAEPVASLTRNGTVATVNIFGHGYANGDTVLISGADQPEYNGRFTISGLTASTFNINVTGTPASPATGNLICRQIINNGSSGWSWYAAADGFGFSLELVNAALPNSAGQNWLPSVNFNGTPGRANSVASANIAPLVLDVAHSPAVPKSSEPVTVTALVRDELAGTSVSMSLFHRNHTTTAPGAFTSTPMLDDGLHGDGRNRDGTFGAVLPAAANGTVIEFYVQATDTNGLIRTWPARTWDTNNTFGQLANALYQVDDEVISNPMPALRLVLTGTERAVFPTPNRNSDAEVNNTFISTDGDGTKVRYLSGARIRGAGSRSRTPPNNRVNIPNDNRWNNLSAINLNGQFVHAQLMGAAVAQKSGVPSSAAHVIQYRINGVNPAPLNAPANGSGNGAGYGSFVMVQPVNGDLAADLFPEDGDGNVYRASTGNHSAQLNYLGTTPDSYVAAGYFKTSNQTENNWTDMFNLCFAFGQVTSDADYFQAMATNVNVHAWMRYFALGTLVNFGETSMFNGRGDDYALYRGLIDPRFVPIGHDFDTIFGQGDTTGTYTTSTNSSIYIMLNPPNTGGNGPNMPLLRRFLNNPVHSPIFFAELKNLADTVFHPAQLNALFDQMLGGWGNGPSTITIDAMKNHAAGRRAAVLAQIPLTLTATSTLTSSNGFLFSATPIATLFGTSHAIDTRRVLVNGLDATRSPWEARWTNTVTLRPGFNRVLVQSLDSNNVEFARLTVDLWHDDGSVQSVSGALAADAVWTAANGPYQVTGNLTVNAGVTLTIQPGTSVYLSPGVNLTVANGGRLIAEGTDVARIRFSAAPGAGNWGGLTIDGGAGSPESRIAYAHFDSNNGTAIAVEDGTVFLDHLTFGNNTRRYLDLDRASFVVQNCVFPAINGSFEPVHGTGGIKAGGRGIMRRSFFGKVQGYNDAFDFTGGNRPGPILQILNNVFMGSDDDLLDFDSTDAWVEGNIFLHTHRNGSPDSASAISGGADNADTSQITAVGNLFYDVDHAANAKQGNFYTLINNTIVRQTKVGSQDTNTAVVILADMNEQGVFTAQGAGMYLEGNIIYDAENLTRHVTTALVTFTNNIIHQLAGTPWTGSGGNNVNADPLLAHIPPFSVSSNFTSWAQAQVMWEYFSPKTGSPAQGTGPNGRDCGAHAGSVNGIVSSTEGTILLTDPYVGGVRGVSLSGEPVGTTPLNSASLRVGVLRTGDGIPTGGFPDGSGFTHYRWRLDGGAWSAETPTATPISLTGLSSGPHSVEVVGRNDAGFYQDDAVFGPDAVVTVSRTWTVNPNASTLRLNEVLARNGGSVNLSGTTPDVIELYNAGNDAIDLTGVRLTDDLANPDKFIFPASASIPARGYLIVYADAAATPGYHLGFALGQEGDAVHLFAAAANGGALLDSVTFGMQLVDLSIGRLADGGWTLTQPTFGSGSSASHANRAAQLGDPRALRINEWLALAAPPFDADFIELYNGASLPVALGGLYLSDELVGWPGRHPIAPLSFVAGNGYVRFIADSDGDAGADHLNFSLSGDRGGIGLYLPDLTPIDCVWYQPQRPNISQGRNPNGGAAIVFLNAPTPGAANPIVTGPLPFGGALVLNEVLANNAGLAEVVGTNSITPDWVELYNGSTNAIDLEGFGLTDSTLLPGKFLFPAGVQIAPGGYLRVRSADGQPASADNTGFGLSSSGGAVYLFDKAANGGGLIDSIVYGLQTPDFTIGRVPDGGATWALNFPTPGAVNSAVTTLGDPANLKVNEWLADPPSGDDDWFEIYNANPLPVALGGLYLTDDLSDFNSRKKHPIAALSFLGAGTNAFQLFRADGNTDAGADHVDFSLRGAGESVGISTASGALINGITFGEQVSNVSQGRFPNGAAAVVSFPDTGSPGESNWRLLTDVVVNEVLTHTDNPLEDAVELRNLTGQPINVSGWWISDDEGTLQKYQIPSPTVIPANGFIVIYENVFTNSETAALPFALSSGGDEVVLSSAANGALTGFRTSVDFGAAANGVSFGRYLTSDNRAEFVALSQRTFGIDDPGSVAEFRGGTGKANAYPRVGPVVISEVMYHPPDLGTNDNTRDEYIQLRNITTAPVALFDSTNVWRLRDAVDFDFPPGTVIAPGDYLLVVGFDPVNNPTALAEFRAAYNLAPGVAIVGPWDGKLANDTDDIELRRPDSPDGDRNYYLVERVRYADVAPWPPEADATGFSLHRLVDNQFGNDPVNWIAAAPTPGPAASSNDTDGDGMPDLWESLHGFDPLTSADAAFDSDGDGLTNLQEFQLGTDPRNSGSALSLAGEIAPGGAQLVLSFAVVPNLSYVLEYADTLGAPWQTLQTFPPSANGRIVQYVVPIQHPTRFHRLRVE